MGRFKLKEHGFEITCLMAFRYAVGRHQTQAMGGILTGEGITLQDVILDNLDRICDNYKCQMLQGIYNEFKLYDVLNEEQKANTVSPYYLMDMYKALQRDFAKHNDGEHWKDGVQMWKQPKWTQEII